MVVGSIDCYLLSSVWEYNGDWFKVGDIEGEV